MHGACIALCSGGTEEAWPSVNPGENAYTDKGGTEEVEDERGEI